MKGEYSVIPEPQQTGKRGAADFQRLDFRCFHKCFLHLTIVVFLNSDTVALLLFKHKKEVGIDLKKQNIIRFRDSPVLKLAF